MDFTSQQAAAIQSRDKNLLVAAAAGSGKTATLVERIVQLVASGVCDIDKMLIVTFTNAAANEMRARIHRAIAAKISTAADSERLERQQILLSGASIMTFHAFCLSVLKRHFAKINLDPKFRDADEHELALLKQDVIENLFEKNYAANDTAFRNFADNFGGNVHGDSDLHALILKLHKFAQSRPYPRDWLNSLAALYENPETFTLADGTSWLDFVKNFALQQAQSVISFSRADCSAVSKILRAKCFDADSDLIHDLAGAARNWDSLRAAIQVLDFKRFDGKKIPPELKDALKSRRDAYKSKIQSLGKNLVTATTAEIAAEMKSLAPSIRQLVKVTLDFDAAFTAAKRDKNIIDFDDMEHLALEIFNADTATAAAYREKFSVIMVDEYQDTNGVQEEIISKIVRANNFFAVGDVKQSIYRFRNADPEIFLQKYRSYPAAADSERVDLSKNFRSRRQILTAVNAIFQLLMTRDAMEIDYDEDARLNLGANFPAAANTFDEPAELCIINLNRTGKKSDDDADDEDSDYKPDFDRLELEVQFIANKIRAMLKKNVWDKNLAGYRPITYRDIVILFRSMDGTAAKIVEVLRKNSIPAYAADKNGYFNAPEIQTVVNLLKILDNARQDIPLAAVMLSPIGGFSTEFLAQLRISDRTADLYTLVSNSPDCKNFLDKINRWREMAYKLSVPELLNAIYRETGYYDFFGGQTNGKIPQANLRMLIDRAAAYEKTAFRGLSRFIQFLRKIRELGNDLSAARTLSESENVVRVMTIHKSKGLEFPVVFVAGLGKQFNLQDLHDTIIPHRNLGVGVYRTVEGGAARVQTFARRIIAKKIKAETLAEELRILYVAFTRAMEKLILVGTVNNSTALKKFDNLPILTAENIQSAYRPVDWLLMVRNFIGDAVEFVVEDSVDVRAETAAEEVTETKTVAPVEKVETPPLDIPAKFSVTEIKRRLDAEDVDLRRITGEKKFTYRRPNFLQKAEITAAEFGTIMHSVMQHLDLSGDLSAAGIIAQIDGMVARQIFTDEQAAAVKRKVFFISDFFTSKIGKRIIFGQEIYRELPFNQYIDAGEIFSAAHGEKIFVQGIIDVLFRDAAGNWVLLDYKTDRNNSDEHFRREYRRQIEYYVRAVEALAHITVAEKYLYLLSAGRLVDMNGGFDDGND